MFGLFQVYNDTPAGYFLIVLGTLLAFISILYWLSYHKQKNRIQNLISTESDNNLKLNECLIWEFTNDYLRFKDYKYDVKIQWIFFKGYRLINDHLFLDQNTERIASMIISQQEIGEENFKKVIDFVKDKIVIP